MVFKVIESNPKPRKPNFIAVTVFTEAKLIIQFKSYDWLFTKPLHPEIGVWKITYKNKNL